MNNKQQETNKAYETPGKSCPFCNAPKGIKYCKDSDCLFATSNRSDIESKKD